MISIKKILLTTDFSENSYCAFPYAIDLAEKYGAEIFLLHVIEPIVAPADFSWGEVSFTEIEEQSYDYSEKTLQRIIEEKFPPDFSVHPIIAHGRAYLEIIETVKSHGIDLIVIATHGLNAIQHLIFGSTTEKVIRKSPVPVLTVCSRTS